MTKQFDIHEKNKGDRKAGIHTKSEREEDMKWKNKYEEKLEKLVDMVKNSKGLWVNLKEIIFA